MELFNFLGYVRRLFRCIRITCVICSGSSIGCRRRNAGRCGSGETGGAGGAGGVGGVGGSTGRTADAVSSGTSTVVVDVVIVDDVVNVITPTGLPGVTSAPSRSCTGGSASQHSGIAGICIACADVGDGCSQIGNAGAVTIDGVFGSGTFRFRGTVPMVTGISTNGDLCGHCMRASTLTS